MVSSVQQNVITASVQNPFAERKNDGSYYISAKTARDIFVTAEKNNEKKSLKTGLIIAGSAVAAALGVFLVVKGIPKNTYKWLQKWSQRLEEKVNKRKLNGESGPVTSFYNSLFKNINSLTDKSRGLNNVGTLKDLMFTELMYKNKTAKKVHNKITSLFERLARHSVNNAYKTSDEKFIKLFTSYENINKEILSANPNREITVNGITKKAFEWVEELNLRRNNIQNALNVGFGKSARNNRYRKMKKADEGLEDKVWQVLTDKADDKRADKVLTTFIAEDLLAADKMAITRTVDLSRNRITHNILDNYNVSKHALDNIASFVDPSDKVSSDLLKALRSNLSSYKKLSGPYEAEIRANVNKQIIDTLQLLAKRLSKASETFGYDKNAVDQVRVYVDEIINTLGTTSKGEFQELLTMYKALLPYDKYVKLRNNTNKAIHKFDKAIKTENDLFFDKLRDLKLGSGPTDVLSLISSVGTVALGLSLSDTKDERISALLKYGIPVIGGVGTSIAMTVGLVSGVKSIIYGFLSSMVINRIGTSIDKYRKEYNKKQTDIKHTAAVKAEINAQNA